MLFAVSAKPNQIKNQRKQRDKSQEKYLENLSLISSIILRKLRLWQKNGLLIRKTFS